MTANVTHGPVNADDGICEPSLARTSRLVRRILLVALLGVVTVGAATPGAGEEVAGEQVTLEARATTKPTVAVVKRVGFNVKLSGVAATKKVTVQRRGNGRWLKVRTVKVNGRGMYKTTVATKKTRKFRVKAGNQTSKPVKVKVTRDACGPRPAKSRSKAWSCSFVDAFNGTTLDRSKWVVQEGFASGVEGGRFACHVDSPDTVRVSGGKLRLRLVRGTKQPCEGVNHGTHTRYRTGAVHTLGLFSQKYGRFEARYKNTATTRPGLHEAFWLWPDQRFVNTTLWPLSGEIDIAETYSSHPTLAVPFLHYKADALGPRPGLNTAWDCVAERGKFNTYALEWKPKTIRVFVNGNLCLVNKSADPAFQERYIMALTQLMGTTGNEHGPGSPNNAKMVVDYVRVWK